MMRTRYFALRVSTLSTLFGVATILSSCVAEVGPEGDEAFADSNAPVETASAALLEDMTGNDCITQQVGGNPPCTANDVRVGSMELVGDAMACTPGETITVTIEATVESGSNNRYDIGFWVNESGGSAKDDPDGTCYRDYLPPPLSPNACVQQGGPYFDNDGDTCGDTYASNTDPCMNDMAEIAPCTSGGGDCLFSTKLFTVDIVCADYNEDGTADVGTCTSWENMANESDCSGFLDTDPGTGSKCSCDFIDITGLSVDPCEGVDCSHLDDQCNDGVCNPDTGACEAEPKAESTPCEDGDACTSETGAPQTPDHCDGAGTCVGVPVDCSGEDNQCNVGTCDPSDGACFADPVEDSTSCDDGDVCTSETGVEGEEDHCFGGVCTGVPVDCSAEDDQCNDGVCNAHGVCVADPKPLSATCEDGMACTSETGTPQTPDHCDGHGTCVGVPVNCSALDDQCNDGLCDPSSGACFADPKALSTPCEDGLLCTSYTGTPQTPDHCNGMGICVGIPVDCSAEDDQCNDGVCNPADGMCEADPKPDSTPCEDGDVCTSETGTEGTPDHCEAGECVGIPVDCSAEDDQCNDGVCDAHTGVCEADPKPDSTECEDGDVCTSETGTEGTPDHCEAGECVGIPVDCSAEDDQCNVGVCDAGTGACEPDPVDDSTECEDGDFCTSETGTPQTPDHCQMGVCKGIYVDCSDDATCTVDSCNPDDGACINDPDDAFCDDMVDCTIDMCDPAIGDPITGCDNDPTSDCATCRTPGFWGTHPDETNTVLMTDPDNVITICGVEVDMYDPCAVEGLCNRPKGDKQLITARHLLATAMNCRLSLTTDDCSDLDIADQNVQDAFADCNAACDCGGQPCSDDAIYTMTGCYPVLDCFNNGGRWSDHIGCAFGQCSEDHDELCNKDEDCTPYYDDYGNNTNVCEPIDNSCHDNLLNVTGILSEPPSNAEPKTCRDAQKSGETLFDECVPAP